MIKEYLEKAMYKILKLYNNKREFIGINTGKSILNIESETITCIERIKRYSLIRYNEKTIKTRETLNQIIEHLPIYFHKCHNSYLVSFKQVKEKTRNEFIMKDGKVVPIARKYVKDMEDVYQRYIENTMF